MYCWHWLFISTTAQRQSNTCIMPGFQILPPPPFFSPFFFLDGGPWAELWGVCSSWGGGGASKLIANQRVVMVTIAVQFSAVPWPSRSSGGHVGRFSRDPLPVSSERVHSEQVRLALAGTSTLRTSITHFLWRLYGVTDRRRCPEGWFWRGCCGA